jgi:hypothetical protein
MPDLYEDPPEPIESNEGDPFEELVGEGKKFKTPQDLAKGKQESDRYIQKLQTELKELREDFQKRLSLDEFLEKLPSTPPTTASNQPPQRADERDDEPPQANLTPEQVESLVQDKINKQKEVDSQERNVDYVRKELIKVWGGNYVKHMEEKTKALGFGKEFATGLAATHPQAFLNLMLDRDVQTTTDVAPPTSSFRTSSAPKGALKYKDYEKMRREDPKRYHSASTQNVMYKDAMEQGEDFYD